MLSGFEGLTLEDLVVMAKWTHLYPSRTQKLSTLAVTIAMPAIVKITRCQVEAHVCGLFYRKSGDYGKVVTPVPIPNTEVKHFSGDNS